MKRKLFLLIITFIFVLITVYKITIEDVESNKETQLYRFSSLIKYSDKGDAVAYIKKEDIDKYPEFNNKIFEQIQIDNEPYINSNAIKYAVEDIKDDHLLLENIDTISNTISIIQRSKTELSFFRILLAIFALFIGVAIIVCCL